MGKLYIYKKKKRLEPSLLKNWVATVAPYWYLYTPQSRYPLALACHAPDQVTVNDHHPFRSTGGAAGVHNNSEVWRDGLHYGSAHCNTKCTLFSPLVIEMNLLQLFIYSDQYYVGKLWVNYRQSLKRLISISIKCQALSWCPFLRFSGLAPSSCTECMLWIWMPCGYPAVLMLFLSTKMMCLRLGICGRAPCRGIKIVMETEYLMKNINISSSRASKPRRHQTSS